MLIVILKKFFKISIMKDMDSRFNIPDFKTLIKASFWVMKNSRAISKKRKILKSRQVRTNHDLKKLGLMFYINGVL